MQKKRFIFLILLVLFSYLCAATELNDITLHFTDQYFNPLTEISLYIDAVEVNTYTRITSTIFLKESNIHEIELPSGSWKIKVSSISGSPYFSEKTLMASSKVPSTALVRLRRVVVFFQTNHIPGPP